MFSDILSGISSNKSFPWAPSTELGHKTGNVLRVQSFGELGKCCQCCEKCGSMVCFASDFPTFLFHVNVATTFSERRLQVVQSLVCPYISFFCLRPYIGLAYGRWVWLDLTWFLAFFSGISEGCSKFLHLAKAIFARKKFFAKRSPTPRLSSAVHVGQNFWEEHECDILKFVPGIWSFVTLHSAAAPLKHLRCALRCWSLLTFIGQFWHNKSTV